MIPFPKTATGWDPLTGAPAPVDAEQLKELGIRWSGGTEIADGEMANTSLPSAICENLRSPLLAFAKARACAPAVSFVEPTRLGLGA